VTVSALFVPVFVSVARTFSPALSWLMGTATPVVSRTLVAAAKLCPPQLGSSSSPERAAVSSAVLWLVASAVPAATRWCRRRPRRRRRRPSRWRRLGAGGQRTAGQAACAFQQAGGQRAGQGAGQAGHEEAGDGEARVWAAVTA